MERPPYEELVDAWWKITDAIEFNNEEWKAKWRDRLFKEVLAMCKWTTSEWNIETRARREK